MLRKLFFEFQYRFAKPPWDSGITPPEVVAFFEKNSMHGRALDVGCGTGTNSIFLAQHGLHVVGVDYASKAIATARDKAQRTNLAIDFHVADVTQLDFLTELFDYVLDIGCFHGIALEGRQRYAAHLARLTHRDSVFMLYAISPRPPQTRNPLMPFRNVGATPNDVLNIFSKDFSLEHSEHGGDRLERQSAWFWFKRK
jgi:cyclopropane fatty-acyl-phospholipid synthase-like methyltransferase